MNSPTGPWKRSSKLRFNPWWHESVGDNKSVFPIEDQASTTLTSERKVQRHPLHSLTSSGTMVKIALSNVKLLLCSRSSCNSHDVYLGELRDARQDFCRRRVAKSPFRISQHNRTVAPVHIPKHTHDAHFPHANRASVAWTECLLVRGQLSIGCQSADSRLN